MRYAVSYRAKLPVPSDGFFVLCHCCFLIIGHVTPGDDLRNNTLMENELNRPDRSVVDLSASSASCRTPTPELDTNFIAWRNPVMPIDEDDSVGPPSPNQNDYYESPEQVKESLQRDLEFIKRYALDAESDVLYSLLASEVDNPNRLEFVMRDMLGLENVPQLIAEYKKTDYKTGDKRSSSDTLVTDSNDIKKRKITITISESVLSAGVVDKNEPQATSSGESSSRNAENSNSEQTVQNGESSNLQRGSNENGESSTSNRKIDPEEPQLEGGAKNEYLDSLRDMFPDADGLFLISESQHIKSWDECSRFINTVMLSGLYPKKGAKDDSWKAITPDSDDDISEIPNNTTYRTSFVESDNETADDADDEELRIVKKIIVKTKTKQISHNECKKISIIDLGNDTPQRTETPENKELITDNTIDAIINDDTMMTVSSIDSSATETYDVDSQVLPEIQTIDRISEIPTSPMNQGIQQISEIPMPSTSELPSSPVFDFDRPMADVLDFLLNDLDETPASHPVPSNSAISTEAKVKEKKRSAILLENLDVGMEIVSSSSEDIRNAQNDELDLILQMPGPSRAVPKAEKKTDPVAKAEKIVETAKKIIETAQILVDKDVNPAKVKLPLAPLLNAVDIEMDMDETKAMDLSPSNAQSHQVVAQLSAPKNIKKLPEPEISSTDSNNTVNKKARTPSPSSSAASILQNKAKIKPTKSIQDATDEGANEVVETMASKLETQKSAEEEKAAKENKWIEEQTSNLIRIFPNTDPTFLKAECSKMECSDNALNEFVVAKLEQNDMPTRAEYEKRIEMEVLQNRYTKNFVIQDFLKAVPDPWTYFSDTKRNCTKYRSHSLCYLKSSFRKHLMRDIQDALTKNQYNLYLAYQHLNNNVLRQRQGKRTDFECSNTRPTTIDIQFLQEVAFIENEKKIKDYLESQRLEKELKFEEARRTNSLLECQCCFDDEVLVEDTVYCPNDHNFCKNCVIRSVEVEMGNGRHQFNCLANCNSQFTLSTLQPVLKPEVFSKVIQAIQMEEIKAAGIEGLVQCPFCNYATILPPEEKVMTCLNPECLKESCRLCKELNHIPLRCEEVEKSEDVKLRTYIENKMTEALVRTCYRCNKKFVKEDGCNKMTCTCGARMCYVCRQPVTDYSHFNGQGGTDFTKCPLYSTNDELHVDAVKRIAEEAKKEVLKANPEKKLVHDPTVILPERRNDTLMPGMVRPGDVLRLPGLLAGGAPVNVGPLPPRVQRVPPVPVPRNLPQGRHQPHFPHQDLDRAALFQYLNNQVVAARAGAAIPAPAHRPQPQQPQLPPPLQPVREIREAHANDRRHRRHHRR